MISGLMIGTREAECVEYIAWFDFGAFLTCLACGLPEDNSLTRNYRLHLTFAMSISSRCLIATYVAPYLPDRRDLVLGHLTGIDFAKGRRV